MRGGHGPTRQLQNLNWGAFNHTSQLRSSVVHCSEEWANEDAEPGQEQKEPTTNGEPAPEEPKG